MVTTFRRNTLALLIAAALPGLAAAQGLQTGPELLRSAPTLVQVNRGDASFDPNEIQRSAVWNAEGGAANATQSTVGGLPSVELYEEVVDREGIVDVSFTVKADGTVSDVELLGGFYDDELRQLALDGIAASVFHPPMAGETAVDWPAYRMRVIQRAPIMPSVSPQVTSELQRVTQLLVDKNYGEAEAALNDLVATRAQTLFDYALLQDQLATVYIGTERPHEALVALRNATSGSTAVSPQSRPDSRLSIQEERFPEEFLTPELYMKALQRRFAVAAALNQAGEALETLAEIDDRGDATATQREQADAIRAKLASEEPIGSQIRLVNGSWIYEVSTRRVFGMTGLQGQVDYVDIACGDNRRRRMAFANDSEFGLPASWEDCKLEFHGADGAQFLLYEYLN